MESKNTQKPVEKFEDLRVYQKAYHGALEIHKLCLLFPECEQGYSGLSSQMRRASKGICANIAEGFSKQRFSSPEFKRYLHIAIGSADELRVWLSFSKDLGYLSEERFHELTKLYSDIAKMLVGLSKSWR